jgi:hypothetical protein
MDRMKLKMHMNKEAVTKRLKIVNDLRRACLSLGDSSAGKKIRKEHADNPSVQRINRALGR